MTPGPLAPGATGTGDSTPLRAPPAARAQRWHRAALEWFEHQTRLLRRPRIEVGWTSRCGTHHGHNQDAVSAAPPLLAVADGVGGGTAGELASSQMLKWCRAIPPSVWQHPQALAALLPQADDALAAGLRQLNPVGLSATTVVAAWLRPSGRCHVTHVGDARLLLGKAAGAGRIWQQVTQDDTYANMGEMPPAGGSPDDPARMVGVGVIGQPAVQILQLRENDMLLLCSDGLHRFMSPAAIGAGVAQAELHASPLATAAGTLAEAAQAAGSTDDVSVLLVRLNPRFGARARFWWGAAGAIVLMVGLAARATWVTWAAA